MARKTEFRLKVVNEPGNLWKICDALYKNGVNIRTIAGIAGQDIIAIISDEETATRKTLTELGIEFKEHDLIVLSVSNMPGEVAYYAKKLADGGVNIDSVYMVGESFNKAELAFAVDDNDRAKRILGL